MEADRQTGTTRRVALTLGCFALVGVVAFVDARVSFIAFSIFYVVPIALASWYGDRTTGLILAVRPGSAVSPPTCRPSERTHPIFAFVNLGCRLLLFVLIATLVSRLKETRDREQHLAELEHEAAERLQELNDIKDALMRSVIVGAREPLGDIYARIVTLGFDLPTLSVTETRAVLAEIADASRRLSTLVNNLIPEENGVGTVGEPVAGSARPLSAS